MNGIIGLQKKNLEKLINLDLPAGTLRIRRTTEVNVIFQNKIPIDDKNNFKSEFKDGNKIIEIMLNRKKDYYLTNTIAFIKNRKKTYSKAIEDLEKIAKEQLQLEKDKKFNSMIKSSIQLDYTALNSYNNNIPTWNFDFDEKEREKYVKEYSYLDTADDKIKTFKTYDFLSHLRNGLDFNKRDEVTWQPRSIDKINFKLIDNDKKIAVRLDASQNLNFKKWVYE